MKVDIKSIGDLLIYLGMLAGAITALGVLLRYAVYKPLMDKLKNDIIPKTDKIHAEITPNHGHSMKDQITRTETKLDTLEQRFSDHLVNHP